MPVAALSIDLRLPSVRSLKEKRSVIRPILEGCRRRYHVAAAEVDHQDRWQRAGVGVAAVSSSYGHLGDILDEVERFVWSHPGIEVLGAHRAWLDADEETDA